ncbi:DUF6036 family nucleotidyltransferase [Haloferula chungangensis]|uniref:DUF6036 family nucleotidyltransferase n=1 Tax=Haloferula chungangensis TaxID=1048331 RepID=A0ABW2LC70_9BACT
MNSDFRDLLRIFEAEGVEYLIVGAYAVMHYTQPRYTKDIDIWLKPSRENSKRIAKAFHEFGVPMVEISREDFEKEGLQYLIGMPPSQIDFLTSLPCPFNFDEAWENRESRVTEGITIHFLGKSELITAKKIASRPQDLADLDEIRRAEE